LFAPLHKSQPKLNKIFFFIIPLHVLATQKEIVELLVVKGKSWVKKKTCSKDLDDDNKKNSCFGTRSPKGWDVKKRM
jgi:hypothetical protein